MSFSRTAMWKISAALLIQAVSHSALARKAATEFDTVIINGVPDVQIRHADTAQLQMPEQEKLAQLLNAEIADGVLTLSCEKNCESLREVPIAISLPILRALHGHNGGRIQVQSDFPLNEKMTFNLGNGVDIDATRAPALNASVQIRNGGKIQLTVCERLHAELNNGGEVIFDGGAVADIKRRNGGEVRQRNDSSPACQHIIDRRDQRRYSTVTVGSQEWLAENLAWLPRVCPLADSECGIWVYGHDNGDSAAARRTTHYQQFGALYSWQTARQACPEGWHLPSDKDWQQLEASLGMPADELEKSIWRGPPIATAMKAGGESGLQVLLAGWRSGDGRFLFAGEHANFWTATSAHEQHAIERLIGRSKQQIGRHTGTMSCGFSVRCVRDVASATP
ncbi:FISUMP domain-containing protein [Permianibacter aggregans]|uniref:Uncharacterized protein (TIGR02145 family) n=1 Tax=Permianibacter aggregans TaxID=1510150 RepID=A0A4R6UFU8_9GAMM|nr:FISUMP domain-containing protein [Permianibacter aggregans]QGX38206.1 hypothetical protein E2H98_00380 [Permianibacter aggregans]TDQ44119.1 uncharacterized protein (TIGR02145 family) [Permianibacter aggregans]